MEFILVARDEGEKCTYLVAPEVIQAGTLPATINIKEPPADAACVFEPIAGGVFALRYGLP